MKELTAVRCQSPLDAEGQDHIAITGKGVFDGGGEAWRPVKKLKMTEPQWAPAAPERWYYE